MPPERKIRSPMNMGAWLKSQAYIDLVSFIESCSRAVHGRAISDSCPESKAVTSIVELLDQLDTFIGDCPPHDDMQQRYGNKAYRDWYAKLTENADALLEQCLPESQAKNVCELKPYLLDSFGNSTRIDYGTGHEAAFVVMLMCLCKLDVFTKDDMPAIVTKIFARYITLVRKLQLTYKMEPAGSQGVWSLDDYQFVSFIWGAAQLIDHPNLTPQSMLDVNVVTQNASDYLFFSCIEFINQVKMGPFAEHSNQLYNISAVPYWTKVNVGLIKMYQAEVLNKFPVVQHFLFGDLFSFEPATQGKPRQT